MFQFMHRVYNRLEISIFKSRTESRCKFAILISARHIQVDALKLTPGLNLGDWIYVATLGQLYQLSMSFWSIVISDYQGEYHALAIKYSYFGLLYCFETISNI